MGGGLSIPDAGGRLSCSCSCSDSVRRLRYVSGARGEALEWLGIMRVCDLLLHVPRRYLDFTHTTKIAFCDVGQKVTVVGTVDKVSQRQPRPRMSIVTVDVFDDTGTLTATFFRQPWLAQQLHAGDIIALSGEILFYKGFKQMKAPFIEQLESSREQSDYARILPVHPTGEGITASWMRRIMSAALADVGDLCDFLPSALVARHGLMTRARALREIHYPGNPGSAHAARRRLAYDELLCLQLALLARRRIDVGGYEPKRHATEGRHLSALLAALPFELTGEQEDAVSDILADMAAPRIMNRLLLGDVGTGKTAVCAVALAAVADSGMQAAVMAPTSVLARQYADKVGPLLDRADVSWTLITGSTSAQERAAASGRIGAGEVCVVFGTTAILSDDIAFANLSLVVIDEQHRFGVNQRALLYQKSSGADLLTMTATPIPRTLALSLYGDVDVSRIKRRPVAGSRVETKVLTPENLDIAYTAIRAAVEQGRQAYVICPVIDAGDEGAELDDVVEGAITQENLHAAASTRDDLARSVFPDYTVELLNGRMPAAEKDETMLRFHAGEIDVLVSTTVVEVGVDVSNATVMLVYNADRFGLATLHQLRGRVGRGMHAGMVFLESAARKGSMARTRLSALEKTADGSELADLDLKLRHEGDVLGYRQSGGVTLSIADLAADLDLIEAAHADARSIARLDPALGAAVHRPLAYEMRRRFSIYFDEAARS